MAAVSAICSSLPPLPPPQPDELKPSPPVSPPPELETGPDGSLVDHFNPPLSATTSSSTGGGLGGWQDFAASVDRFTREQRVTNAILCEVASALGASGAASAAAAGAAATQPGAGVSEVVTGVALRLSKLSKAPLNGRRCSLSKVKREGPARGKVSDAVADVVADTMTVSLGTVPDSVVVVEKVPSPIVSEVLHCKPNWAQPAPPAAPARDLPQAQAGSQSSSQEPGDVVLGEAQAAPKHDTSGTGRKSDEIVMRDLTSWVSNLGMFRWTTTTEGNGAQLMRYDFDSISAWAAIPCIVCSASVFRLRRSVGQQSVLQLLIILGLCVAIQSQGLSEERLNQLRLDTESVSLMSVNLKRFVPFFLGLFISLCLSRWWSLRSVHLHGLITAIGKLSFWLRTALPDKARWVQDRVERHCMLGHKLVYLCAQGKQDSASLKEVLKEGYLSEEECADLMNRLERLPAFATHVLPGLFDLDLACLPFAWAAQLIYRTFLFGVRTKGEHGVSLPAPVCVKLMNCCVDARKSISSIEMTLSSPLPFPYFHLVCLLVHFSTLFECVRSGLVLGTSVNLSPHLVIVETFTCLSGNFLFLGMLCLAAVLMDPFGNDAVDFPAAMFEHKLWKIQHFASSLLDPDVHIDEELEARFAKPGQHIPLKADGSDDEEDDDEEDDDDDDCD